MKDQRDKNKNNREWLLLLLLLPVGVMVMSLAGQVALSQPSTWRVRAAMGSALDPYVELGSEPVGPVGQIRAEIMTAPVWMDSITTPDAVAGTPVAEAHQPTPDGSATVSPPATVTLVGSPTSISTATATLIPTNTAVPTATIYYPPPTKTKVPPPKPTNTKVPPTPTNTPVPEADLSITKTDGVTAYTPGGSVTYTIVVSNAGPDGITGATVTDNFPAQVSSASWTCLAAGGASCTSNGTGNISDTVNIPFGGTLTYTVNAVTASSASGDMANSAQVSLPAGAIDPNTANNSATDPKDTASLSADLAITKTGGVKVYQPGDTLSYTVTVTNNGPSDATGFDISDTVPAGLTGVSVSCAVTGTASCGTDASVGNSISFMNASLSAGAGNYLTLSISGTVSAGITANITNTATLSVPSTDPNSGNNSSSHTHERVYSTTYGNIGTVRDGSITNIGGGSSVILNLTTKTSGDSNWDLIYYEFLNGCGIAMDWVTLQVGDGTNWYTIFNWGDGVVDANTNIASLGLPESDTRSICSTDLYDVTGIAIDLDAVVSSGTYPYIKIISPIGGDNVVEVDAITPLP